EDHAHHGDAADIAAQSGDAVIVFVEDRHDDDLVDDVPHVDQTGEVGHFAFDAFGLDAGDLGVVEFQEPVGGDGVPGQGVALDGVAALVQQARGGQDAFGVGSAA